MRIIDEEQIVRTVKQLFIDANYHLSRDVVSALRTCKEKERSPRAQTVLGEICENLHVADECHIPICQDTGMAVVFIEIGTNVHIRSEKSLQQIVDEGVKQAYIEGYLRRSVVRDPLRRSNTGDNTPAILHVSLVRGDRIKITAAPKGFGSENMSRIQMFTPSSSREEIIEFVVQTVALAGSNPCPPIVIGVGIGGTFEYAAWLAKKALIRPLDEKHPDPFYAQMEEDILAAVNALNIGPQGFGGDTTALKVNVEPYPTHIAGLPVAVNLNCHVCRHAEEII